MVRTHSGPDPRAERRRLTASVRAQRANASRVQQAQQEDETVVPDPAPEVDVLVQVQQEGDVPLPVESFPGGPEDTSVLRSFGEHVAHMLWNGVDRHELKVVSHGRKIGRFSCNNDEVQMYIRDSGLGPLCNCSHSTVDKGLLSAFIERWHKDTCTFHLPCGEMTVTLDDVSCLLHLPITGAFFTLPLMDRDIACSYLVDLLGVTQSEAKQETDATRGAHVRFSWLQDVYRVQLEQGEVENTARAYLLHLVGCTIFADKSSTSVDVAFLELFRDLRSCSGYAWGAVALAYLYDQLFDASRHNVKQCGGYMTLLQGWIFEHFSRIGNCTVADGYNEELPRVQRWTPVRGAGAIHPFRVAIDLLRADEIIWQPYEGHRVHRPFEDISLYSGFIRCGRLRHPYLPERVMRQFGHVQSIPPSPLVVTGLVLSLEEIDARWSQHMDWVVAMGSGVTNPAQCAEGYMQWFRRISHPFLIPPGEGVQSTVVDMQPELAASVRSDHFDQQVERFQNIRDLLQEMLDRGMVAQGTDAWEHTQRALTLARGGIQFENTYQRRRKSTSRPSTS